mmetsp:Transcript_49281/g.110571  ORF Transcript_49281/g.110571 Transcript_49281/m.110571 type:complete len:304 (+) Transcript_49281:47-958(+)
MLRCRRRFDSGRCARQALLRRAGQHMERAKVLAARQQKDLVSHNVLQRAGRPASSPKVLVTAVTLLQKAFVWTSPPESRFRPSLLSPMFGNVYRRHARFPQRRVVIDSVITVEEAEYYVHDAKDAHGDPLFHIDETLAEDLFESSTAFQDWPSTPLNQAIADRVRTLIRCHFGEKRPLHLAGALLRRTRPGGQCSCESGPTVCHVDKANVSFYDYSAIVYLTTKGEHFDGGALAFNDPDRDELIEPRVGRCVLFASGPHHLHQAQAVTAGTRMIMALWFSLNCKLVGEKVLWMGDGKKAENQL